MVLVEDEGLESNSGQGISIGVGVELDTHMVICKKGKDIWIVSLEFFTVWMLKDVAVENKEKALLKNIKHKNWLGK